MPNSSYHYIFSAILYLYVYPVEIYAASTTPEEGIFSNAKRLKDSLRCHMPTKNLKHSNLEDEYSFYNVTLNCLQVL